MRRATVAALVACALTVTSSIADGQRQPVTSGLSVAGIPHPASAAIAFWDSLGLAESQIHALRQVEERTSRALYRIFERQVVDTGVSLRLWRSTAIDSVALVHEVQAQLHDQVQFTLALLRARDETFTILTPAQRGRLESLVLGHITNPEARALSACTDGGAGGSVSISDRAELIFGVQYDGDSARISGVVVAQADVALTSSPRATHSPPSWPSRGGGASSGRWIIQNDKDAAWIDSTRVDREGHNVVLLQGVDRVTSMPTVAGLTSVPPSFYTGGCRSIDSGDALKAHVLRSPAVRTFLDRPARRRDR